MIKPIKVSNGEFVTDSSFKPVMFSESQAKRYGIDLARRETSRLAKSCLYRFKFKGVKDCGDYWTITIS